MQPTWNAYKKAGNGGHLTAMTQMSAPYMAMLVYLCDYMAAQSASSVHSKQGCPETVDLACMHLTKQAL